jgi:hypothetical protein
MIKALTFAKTAPDDQRIEQNNASINLNNKGLKAFAPATKKLTLFAFSCGGEIFVSIFCS